MLLLIQTQLKHRGDHPHKGNLPRAANNPGPPLGREWKREFENRNTRDENSIISQCPGTEDHPKFRLCYEEGIGGRPHHQDHLRLGGPFLRPSGFQSQQLPPIRSVPGRETYDQTGSIKVAVHQRTPFPFPSPIPRPHLHERTEYLPTPNLGPPVKQKSALQSTRARPKSPRYHPPTRADLVTWL